MEKRFAWQRETLAGSKEHPQPRHQANISMM
jgi:hypothetical protein